MQPRSPHSGATEEELRFLSMARDQLLSLHSALLEFQRAGQSASPYELLRLLTSAPQFEWLRPISRLISEIDETLESRPKATGAMVRALMTEVAQLVRLEGCSDSYRERYKEAIQGSVEVAGVHGDLRQFLKRVV